MKPNYLVNLYKQSIKDVPLLKYSWILITTICILALANYYQLNRAEVFLYAIAVAGISLLSFLLSLLVKGGSLFMKIAVNVLVGCITLVICTAVLKVGYSILIGKPVDFDQWFTIAVKETPKANGSKTGALGKDTVHKDTTKTFSLSFDDDELINAIVSKAHLRLKDEGPDYKISLTYDKGAINELDGTFSSNDSYPLILINGRHPIPITEYPIKAQFGMDNRNLLAQKISSAAAATPASKINLHLKQILKWLK